MCTPGSPGGLVTEEPRRSLTPTAEGQESCILLYMYTYIYIYVYIYIYIWYCCWQVEWLLGLLELFLLN